MAKHYTLKEANETLEIVRPILKEMTDIGEKIRARQPELWALVQKSALCNLWNGYDKIYLDKRNEMTYE